MSAIVNVETDDIPITLYDADNVGRAGLSVASVARRKGVTVSATAVTDRGSGDYDLTYTFPSVGTWRVTSTATIDGEPATDITDVQVETAAQADPAAALAAGTVTVVSPLSPDGGTLRLIQGDSYAAAQSRQLSWTLSAQPDLTAAALTLTIVVKGVTVTKTGLSGSNLASGAPTITATLTKLDTAGFEPAIGLFDLSATIGSDELTLVRGRVDVKADV